MFSALQNLVFEIDIVGAVVGDSFTVMVIEFIETFVHVPVLQWAV
jgi:hypothetical protein